MMEEEKMTKLTPSEIHQKAEVAREQDRHDDSLKLLEEAIAGYLDNKDYKGVAMALQSRVLTYKHLFLTSKDPKFATKAENDALASLNMAKEHELSEILGHCYFRVGEIAIILEDFEKACQNYQKALDNYQGSKSEKGDFRYHLGEALYRKGEKEEGKRLLTQGLAEIVANEGEVDPFLTHVWESGAHMRMADLFRDDFPQEAKEHLKTAQKIANADSKLVIRKRQIEDLAKTFF